MSDFNSNSNEEKQEEQENKNDDYELPQAKAPIPKENNPYMSEFVYTLQDIIDVAKKFNNGELSIEDMNKFGNTLIIRDYMPLMDKMSIVVAIMSQHLYNTSSLQEIRIAELYRNLFFYGLLQGYAMIDCRDRELINYENYDLLYPVFGRFIKSYCKDDWEVFMQYIRDAMDIYSSVNLYDTINGIEVNALKEATKENNKLVNEIKSNQELIKNLSEITKMNDPMLRKIKEELQKISIKPVAINDGEQIKEEVKKENKEENNQIVEIDGDKEDDDGFEF